MNTSLRMSACIALPLLVALLLAALPAAPAEAQRSSRDVELPLEGEKVSRQLLDEDLPRPVRKVLDTSVGFALPSITDLDWATEETMSDDDFAGNIVVVQTWTWQTPDGRAAPRRVARFAGEGVRVLSVHTPQGLGEDFDNYMERRQERFPVAVAVDRDGSWLDEIGAFEEPTTIIVDAAGRIRVAGADQRRITQIIRELQDEELSDDVEVKPLPSRSERVEKLLEEDDQALPARPQAEPRQPAGEFPPHNPNVRGATDLQGKRGPAVIAEAWLNGEPELEGKVVMAEFWATWCGPCIAGIPHLNELQAEFEDELVIVGISDEDVDTVRPAISRHNMRYTIAVDTRRRTHRGPNPRGIPHCIVMSPDGIVRWQGHPAALTKDIMGRIVAASAIGGDGETDGPTNPYDKHSWAHELENASEGEANAADSNRLGNWGGFGG